MSIYLIKEEEYVNYLNGFTAAFYCRFAAIADRSTGLFKAKIENDVQKPIKEDEVHAISRALKDTTSLKNGGIYLDGDHYTCVVIEDDIVMAQTGGSDHWKVGTYRTLATNTHKDIDSLLGGAPRQRYTCIQENKSIESFEKKILYIFPTNKCIFVAIAPANEHTHDFQIAIQQLAEVMLEANY